MSWREGRAVLWVGRREKEQTGVSPAVSLSGLQAPSRATAVLMGPRAAASRPPPPQEEDLPPPSPRGATHSLPSGSQGLEEGGGVQRWAQFMLLQSFGARFPQKALLNK